MPRFTKVGGASPLFVLSRILECVALAPTFALLFSKKGEIMKDFDTILYILSSAALAGAAQFVKGLRDGFTVLRSALEGAVAFFLGMGFGATAIKYLSLDPVLSCGLAAIVGLIARPVLREIEELTDVVSDYYQNKFKKKGGEK